MQRGVAEVEDGNGLRASACTRRRGGDLSRVQPGWVVTFVREHTQPWGCTAQENSGTSVIRTAYLLHHVRVYGGVKGGGRGRSDGMLGAARPRPGCAQG